MFLTEIRNKLVARNSDQDHVSELESFSEQLSVAWVYDVEGSSESHKLVRAG